ncbi:MAG TPA: CHAT domain-containing protein, partial [Actinopolymorphaceae bacterium]
AMTPPKRRLYPRFQANLALALVGRYEVTGRPADLEEATALARQALLATPTEHPHRPERLSTLARILQASLARAWGWRGLDPNSPAEKPADAAGITAWFRRRASRRQRQQLDQLIDAAAAAVVASPHGHDLRPLALTVHGQSLALRGILHADPASFDAAVATFEEVAIDRTAPARLRAAAARLWAFTVLGRTDDPDPATAAEPFELAVELIPRTAPRHLVPVDQENHLTMVSGLACHAAACALAQGRPRRALELLETGRGVLLGRVLDARAELTELYARQPDLARRFEAVRSRFERVLSALDRPARAAESVEDRLALTREWDEVVDAIRRVPGFEGFLHPPTADGLLRSLGARGPVVVVNTSVLRCDALVIVDGDIRVVELPHLRFADLVQRSGEFRAAVLRACTRVLPAEDRAAARRTLRELLAWLWNSVAEPVLDSLAFLDRPTTGSLPRLWWVPTGPSTILPLHAAAPLEGPGVLDLVVSSHAPTVRSLDGGQSRDRLHGRPTALLVGVPDAPDMPSLPRVHEEIAHLRDLVPESRVLFGERAVRQSVLGALPGRGWAHFACHAVSEADGDQAGHLVLHDHRTAPLTVADIAALSLDGAEMAYLSACSTSVPREDLADEALHITGAFRMAGFHHVIGTLWSVGDDACQAISQAFYTELLSAGAAELEPPRALHEAVRRLRREREEAPEEWAA